MNDREFDALLESAAPELPPDDIARDVTPWRRAIGNILGGSAMCSITLNFFCLNYLLPTIGVILQLLGFRPLRRENRWFRACWLLAVLRAALFLPCIVLNATIYSNAVYASSVGTYFGINGIVTFKNAHLEDTVREVGIDRLLLETDAPYLAPVPYRGKRNEPSYLPRMARRIADILGVTAAEVEAATTANAFRLFGEW